MGPTADVAWTHVHADLLARRRRPATVRAYRYALADFWAWLPRPLHRAGVRDLDRYLARPVRPRSPARGAYLSTSSQRVYGGQIVEGYAALVRAGVLRRNPLAGWIPPRVGDPPPRSLDLAVVRRAVARATDRRRRCMVMLAYHAGLRAGEIARLRIEDVDLGEHPHLRVDGKGGRVGMVGLTAELEAFLRGHLAGRPHTGPVVESRRRPGRHLIPTTVSRELGCSLRDAEVDATGHQYRHTCATELLRAEEGRNLHGVKGVLRHRSLRSTERYTLAYSADAEAALRRLPAVLPTPRRPSIHPSTTAAAPAATPSPGGQAHERGPRMRNDATRRARAQALAAGIVQISERLAELVAEAAMIDAPVAPDDVVEVRPVLVRWAAEVQATLEPRR